MNDYDKIRKWVFYVCLMIAVTSFSPAQTVWQYRSRGPDTVTVPDILKGTAHAGDWITVSGVDWSGQAFVRSVTTRSGGRTTQSRSQYHLLVSPDSAEIERAMEVPRALQALDARARTCPPEGRTALLREYDRLLHEASEDLAAIRPIEGVPFEENVEKPDQLEQMMADINTPELQRLRSDMSALAAPTPEEREKLGFENQRQAIHSQFARLFRVCTPTTVTGMLAGPPEDVVSHYEELSHIQPKVEIRVGSSPLGISLALFGFACAGLLASLAWAGAVRWRRGK